MQIWINDIIIIIIKNQNIYKMLLATFKRLHGLAPSSVTCWSENCHLYSDLMTGFELIVSNWVSYEDKILLHGRPHT